MRSALIWVALTGLLGAALTELQSASRKFQTIETARLPAGSRVQFTPGEINSWMREEAKTRVPQGVRDLRLDLAAGRATGSALIDFVKLHQAATGESPGWFMRNLLAGERPVTVTARFESRNSSARVDVELVEVSGVPIEGRVLDFLIDNYVRPTFPNARVSEWFPLHDRVDRFAVSPGGVTVFIGR